MSIPLGVYRKEIVNSSTSGTKQMTLTTATGLFAVGDTITDDSDAGITGVVTRVWGAGATQTIQYRPTAGVFSAATGAFTAAPSGAKATAVALVAVGPVMLWPAGVENLVIQGRVTGAATTGNSIEMTWGSAEEIDAGTAVWVAVNAAMTSMTNTAFDETKIREMGTRIVTAFRVLRNDATDVRLLAIGLRRAS